MEAAFAETQHHLANPTLHNVVSQRRGGLRRWRPVAGGLLPKQIDVTGVQLCTVALDPE